MPQPGDESTTPSTPSSTLDYATPAIRRSWAATFLSVSARGILFVPLFTFAHMLVGASIVTIGSEIRPRPRRQTMRLLLTPFAEPVNSLVTTDESNVVACVLANAVFWGVVWTILYLLIRQHRQRRRVSRSPQ